MDRERPMGPRPVQGQGGGGQQAGGPQGGGGWGQEQQQAQAAAQYRGPRLEQYYSNVAMVAVSPREISVLFGRFVPVPQAQDQSGLMPIYEKQILMTVEQAQDLVRTLSQAVQDFRTRGQQGQQPPQE